MPTTLHAYPHPPLAYVRNAAKRAAASNLLRYLLHGGGRDWTRLAEPLLRRVATRGGVFHLWGHSWDIDQTAGWRRLNDVLKMMADHAKQAPCLTNGEICQQVLPRASIPLTAPAASRPAG
jgi:hypothetical protein